MSDRLQTKRSISVGTCPLCDCSLEGEATIEVTLGIDAELGGMVSVQGSGVITAMVVPYHACVRNADVVTGDAE